MKIQHPPYGLSFLWNLIVIIQVNATTTLDDCRSVRIYSSAIIRVNLVNLRVYKDTAICKHLQYISIVCVRVYPRVGRYAFKCFNFVNNDLWFYAKTAFIEIIKKSYWIVVKVFRITTSVVVQNGGCGIYIVWIFCNTWWLQMAIQELTAFKEEVNLVLFLVFLKYNDPAMYL